MSLQEPWRSIYPENVRSALEVPRAMGWFLSGVTLTARALGLWRRPICSDGCFEHMSLYDKIRYVHKAQHPATLAERGSGLERYFRDNRAQPPGLPEGFTPDARLTLSAVGDLIPHPLLPASGEALYGEIAPLLFGADVSCANLEAMLADGEVQGLTFRRDEAPPLVARRPELDVLTGPGARRFTVLTTACNHSLDLGLPALVRTLDYLQERGIRQVGSNRDPGAQETGLVLEAAGFRIGLVGATFGLNGKLLPPGEPHWVNVVPFTRTDGEVDLSLLGGQLARLRAEGCEVLVASVHWGREFEFFPTRQQVALGHQLAELGADVIFGHHPHNIQPVEWYRPRRDPQRVVPICHSLGNLTSPFAAPHVVLSLRCGVTLARGLQGDRPVTLVERAEPVPLYQELVPAGGGGGRAQTRIRRLVDLLRAPPADGAPESPARLAAAAAYADLVLGDGWRGAA